MEDDEEFSTANFSKQEKERKALKEAKEATSQDPEYLALVERTRKVQTETVESSDNAVRTLRETRKVSETTKSELVRQGEDIKEIKGSADRADENVVEAYENTRKIDKYSRFIPIKGFFSNKKKKKEDKALAKEQKSIEREAQKANKIGSDYEPSTLSNSAAPDPRREYSDDNERCIDDNLDEMSSHLQALKQDAHFMQTTIKSQDKDLRTIQATTSHTQNVMEISDKKLQKHL